MADSHPGEIERHLALVVTDRQLRPDHQLSERLTRSRPQPYVESLTAVRAVPTLDARLETVKARSEAAKADLVKWVAGLLIAQAALIAALVKLL